MVGTPVSSVHGAGSSRISRAEFQAGLELVGLRVSEAESVALFASIDHDHDNQISYEEMQRRLEGHVGTMSRDAHGQVRAPHTSSRTLCSLNGMGDTSYMAWRVMACQLIFGEKNVPAFERRREAMERFTAMADESRAAAAAFAAAAKIAHPDSDAKKAQVAADAARAVAIARAEPPER